MQEYTKPSVETISSGSSSFVWRKQDPTDSGLLEQYTKVPGNTCTVLLGILHTWCTDFISVTMPVFVYNSSAAVTMIVMDPMIWLAPLQLLLQNWSKLQQLEKRYLHVLNNEFYVSHVLLNNKQKKSGIFSPRVNFALLHFRPVLTSPRHSRVNRDNSVL